MDGRSLYWSPGGRGRVTVDGHGADMQVAPVIGGKPVNQMHYVPRWGVARIRREPHEAERDMEPLEIAEAEAILTNAVTPAWGDRPPPSTTD